jgi:glycogen operon protein
MDDWIAREGYPGRGGATHIERLDAYNFAIYSKHATSIRLNLYRREDVDEPCFTYDFDPIRNKTGRIWHCMLTAAAVSGAVYYSYTIGGPSDPANGLRFDREKIILDSLRYWVREVHVDGFRFDLASIFTRDTDGSINLGDPPIISAIRSDPTLRDVRLIAEAWDLGSYQLGRAFPGVYWTQWNDKFRDDVRSFVRGDRAMVPALMRRICGSDDLFPDTFPDSYRPYQGVNFVTAHDGFTLYDLVSYNEKHNEANGHDNMDGADDNRSWNCGWEGDADVPDEVMDSASVRPRTSRRS